ncbi:FAD/NAD(P)-binding domain-containing protein [Colletotrichum zoysiae]|uniref:FAD/NAD(P)-binding domain-containing protein n=1 Tax=Colletotrichum zoysiae TaxID=1216348 RepID=A0AAD9HR44_9PEZI|nr:FAD/NAD(P)-binding domain-containing protein [Colletotrichum zoysiae]
MTATHTSVATTPIAIIGAGPCGLTFARLLETKNIDYVVYERDADSSLNPMSQGGTLDLHADSGQEAIKKAGLFEEFKRLARWDATRFVIQNADCTLKTIVGETRDAPEIDRFQLRQLLLQSIPPHKVHWGHGVRSIERDGNSSSEGPGVTINFTNGASTSGFRLVVGADGAWSKVRPFVTPAKPEYSGKMFLESRISQGNPSYASLLELAGPGTMMAMGHGSVLIINQVSDRSYRLYMGLEGPETLIRTTLDVDDVEATREKLLSSAEFYKEFAPSLRQFIADAEGPFRPWLLHRMPVSSLAWDRVPGVTLLGDAAHASTPFVGEGVNMAMHDALKLAQSIEKHCIGPTGNVFEEPDRIEQALVEYETEMLDRAQGFIRRCILSEDMFFADDGAQLFIDLITGAVENQTKQLFETS